MAELRLIRDLAEIEVERLKAFPFWISTPELDIDEGYWLEVDPPEEVEFDSGEGWIKFPEDFSEQRLFDDDEENIEFWTPDLIELAQKHNGILFVCEGWGDVEKENADYSAYCYPLVFVILRFTSELDRMAAIRDIRSQHKNPTLFLGQHPEEPVQMQGLLDLAIARSELEVIFQKSSG